MDIVSKLNRELLEQDFLKEQPASDELFRYKEIARHYACMEKSIAVLSDMRTNTSYIYYGGFSKTLGIEHADREGVVYSIWEESILKLIHPDDLHSKYLQELRFFHFMKRQPVGKRFDYYLMNKNIITSLFFNVEEWIQIDFNFLNTPIQVVYISALLLYTVPAIFKTASSRSNRIIEYRKKSGVLLVMFFIAIIPFFLSKTQTNMSFVFAIPLSFFLCNLFLENPKEKYTNMFLLIFILLSIFKVYFQV